MIVYFLVLVVKQSPRKGLFLLPDLHNSQSRQRRDEDRTNANATEAKNINMHIAASLRGYSRYAQSTLSEGTLGMQRVYANTRKNLQVPTKFC